MKRSTDRWPCARIEPAVDECTVITSNVRQCLRGGGDEHTCAGPERILGAWDQVCGGHCGCAAAQMDGVPGRLALRSHLHLPQAALWQLRAHAHQLCRIPNHSRASVPGPCMKNKGFLPRKNAQFCAASKESCPPSDVSDNPPCMHCSLTAGWYLLDQVLHNNACKTQTDLDIAWTHSFRHHGIRNHRQTGGPVNPA